METFMVTLSDQNAGTYICTTVTEKVTFDVTTISNPSSLTT